VLAGTIGGLGAYVAVKVDIAVLMDNQKEMKIELGVLKDVSDRQIRQESKMEFFQYRLDALTDRNKVNVKL
jgi:hypothetical protein